MPPVLDPPDALSNYMLKGWVCSVFLSDSTLTKLRFWPTTPVQPKIVQYRFYAHRQARGQLSIYA